MSALIGFGDVVTSAVTSGGDPEVLAEKLIVKQEEKLIGSIIGFFLSDSRGDMRGWLAGVSALGLMPSVQVHTQGLASTRRALRRAGNEADKAIQDELKSLSQTVAGKARGLAPVRTGKLRASIRPSVTIGKGAAVRSSLAYAPVQEWGGTIRPRGVPIHIKGSHMISRAVDDSAPEVEAALHRVGEAIERAWLRG